MPLETCKAQRTFALQYNSAGVPVMLPLPSMKDALERKVAYSKYEFITEAKVIEILILREVE